MLMDFRVSRKSLPHLRYHYSFDIKTTMKLRFLRFVIFLSVTLLLAGGCNMSLEKSVPTVDVEYAKYYVELLRGHYFSTIEKDLSEELRTADTQVALSRMAQFFPEEDALAIKVVGFSVYKAMTPQNSVTTTIGLEYQFKDQNLFVNVSTRKIKDDIKLVGFNVNQISDSALKAGEFSLKNKSTFHYLMLVAAVLSPLFIIYALIRCITRKTLTRKWLWIIFILFGFGKLTFNWATGEWDLIFLNLQALGAGFFIPNYGPLYIFVSLPLGAIVFLLRKQEKPLLPSKEQG